jgi:hypothetical protein
VQIRETVGKTWTEMQQGDWWFFGHAGIAISHASHDTFE